jgi:putative phosphoesterase
MRIAVIADTHDRLPAGLAARLCGADEIWHLGDVCEPSTLAPLEQLGPPLRVVLGNNDPLLWPEKLTLTREGVRCRLIHIPPRQAPKGIDLVLHGHTHVPRDEELRGVRWLNPGCVSRPNRGAPASFAWLLLEPGRTPTWKVVPLT